MKVLCSCLGRVTGCLGRRPVVVSLGRVQKFGMVPTIRPLSPAKRFSVRYLWITRRICISLIGLPLGYMLEGTFVLLRKITVHFVASTASGIALVPRASCPINTGNSFTGVYRQVHRYLASLLRTRGTIPVVSYKFSQRPAKLKINKFLSAKSFLHPT